MTEELIRIDATWVKEGTYKLLYTVPTWKTFVVSKINTTSANVVSLKIWNVEVWESSRDWDVSWFFEWFVINSDEEIYVTHAFSWVVEDITMSWSLVG